MRVETAIAGCIVLITVGCSGSSGGGGEMTTPAAGGSLNTTIGSSGTVGTSVRQGDSGSTILLGATCAASEWEGEALVADLYVMFDQSGSMATPTGTGTRLDAVRSAVFNFLDDPDSAGLAVGLGYFGYMPIGKTSCQSSDYRAPAVTIGELPANTGALLKSLNGVSPVGETPTGAAIRGACGYANDYQTSHPGHVVSILLVTDGVPEAPVSSPACAPTLSDAVQAASDCRMGTTGIRTYVLGVGPALANLQQITAAGGTDHAYLVESGDVSAQVLAALDAIRLSAAIPCQLRIPTAVPGGPAVDSSQVNVIWRAPNADPTVLSGLPAASACDAGGGWYYDDAANPSKVVLCSNTCKTVEETTGGHLTFAVGCATRVR